MQSRIRYDHIEERYKQGCNAKYTAGQIKTISLTLDEQVSKSALYEKVVQEVSENQSAKVELHYAVYLLPISPSYP